VLQRFKTLLDKLIEIERTRERALWRHLVIRYVM